MSHSGVAEIALMNTLDGSEYRRTTQVLLYHLDDSWIYGELLNESRSHKRVTIASSRCNFEKGRVTPVHLKERKVVRNEFSKNLSRNPPVDWSQ